MSEVHDRLRQLAAPLPAVRHMPKVWCRECRDRSATCNRHRVAVCQQCKVNVSEAHACIPYVSIGQVIRRLLEVDPEWSFEPIGDGGRPQILERGNEYELWIKLTVCGVSRIGVGVVRKDERSTEVAKKLLSNAIKNAASRFGVSVPEESEEERVSAEGPSLQDPPASQQVERQQESAPPNPPAETAPAAALVERARALPEEAQVKLKEFMTSQGWSLRRGDLGEAELRTLEKVIERLEKLPRCAACNLLIDGKVAVVEGEHYHADCAETGKVDW